MEIVVTFTKGDESRNDMIARGVAIIERLVAEPMSQRVNAEGRLLDEEDAEDACVDKPTKPIVPPKS